MIEKRFTIRLGKNNEFKEIIDHSKQDKHISVFDFLKQVGEQDKAFKKLEKENKELKLQLEAFKDKLCELGVSDVKLYGKRYYTGLEEWLND